MIETDEADEPPSITLEDHQRVPVDTVGLRRAAERVRRTLGVPTNAALSISLLDPEAMARLKHEALGIHAPTDVLSFQIDDPHAPSPGPLVLGDVVLCPAVADRQARALGRTLDDELERLLIHGILHLLGADHAEPHDELAMASEERRVLREVRT